MRAYVEAFVAADVEALVALLREDAELSMPATPSLNRGREAIGRWLGANVLTPDARGRFRGTITAANGTLAVALHLADGTPLGLHVITLRDGAIAEVVAFMEPSLLGRFELDEA